MLSLTIKQSTCAARGLGKGHLIIVSNWNNNLTLDKKKHEL